MIVLVDAVGFTAAEALRRLGPPPLGEAIAYSRLVVDRNGKLLRPFTTAGGTWRLPADTSEVDPRFLAMLLAYEDRRFTSTMASIPAPSCAPWDRRSWPGMSCPAPRR